MFDSIKNGWGVGVLDIYKTEYGAILESINGQSINSLEYTFWDCDNLTTAPIIPNSVTNMDYTFWDCDNLTTAPVIPENVTNMYGTFQYCTALTGEIEVNATHLKDADFVVQGTIKPITITGSCPDRERWFNMYNFENNNITIV